MTVVTTHLSVLALRVEILLHSHLPLGFLGRVAEDERLSAQVQLLEPEIEGAFFK